LPSFNVGDITYIRTWEGWLYLAIILDEPDLRSAHL